MTETTSTPSHSLTQNESYIIESDSGSRGIRPATESLLLGIRLRGWLTDSERDFLDSLAPGRLISFLIRGQHYLHPEGVELFPFGLIEAAVNQGCEAVFTHRYENKTDASASRCAVHTAVINPSVREPLVLGCCGPDEQVLSQETVAWFSKLVSWFRHAYRYHQHFADKIAKTINSETPTIVVNRSSGRVVAPNEAAASLLAKDPKDLIDLEYGRIKSDLHPLLPQHQLKMSNVNHGELYLTIITMPSTHPRDREDRSDAPDEFVQGVESRLAEVTEAARTLAVMARKVKDAEAVRVSSQVVAAANRLGRYITHHSTFSLQPLLLQRTSDSSAGTLTRNSNGLLHDHQRAVIMKALVDNNWNFTQTAGALGIGRTTLWRKVKKYNLKRETVLR